MASNKIIWGLLLHLGYNMWADRETPERDLAHITARPYLRFDESLWNDLLPAMVAAGVNMVVLDLGEGVRYKSHPELAVRGSWPPEKLHQELIKMRDLGLEPIPKLNFSTCHDAWLGPYARAISTEIYYQVCRDLIQEVIALFDGPRFFHLGMDEETYQHQQLYEYVVIRQFDLWWHDLFFYAEEVERAGVRPWVWSDYVWHHSEMFYKLMPRSILQSNWYYGSEFGLHVDRAKAYNELEAHGYDQVPTGSTWLKLDNLEKTVAYCREAVAPARLKGFLQTVWRPTLEDYRDRHLQAIDCIAKARALWEG